MCSVHIRLKRCCWHTHSRKIVRYISLRFINQLLTFIKYNSRKFQEIFILSLQVSSLLATAARTPKLISYSNYFFNIVFVNRVQFTWNFPLLRIYILIRTSYCGIQWIISILTLCTTDLNHMLYSRNESNCHTI